jgi:Flp pilus assembly protein TadG
MKKGLGLISRLKNKRGAVAVIVAILLAVLIGFTALSVDVGHLYVVHNELQNAADAGALAGARVLYNGSGTEINTGANDIAYNAAVANMSESLAVEVNLDAGDVQRGHWSFATSTFTPNDSTDVVDLFGTTTEELDLDLNFINAVRVICRRETAPAASYFARIFGYLGFIRQDKAVAYIGFAGTLSPGEVDQPIAICEESILNDDDEYDCSVGRMINSGQNIETSNTGGWANLDTTDCSGGTNSNEVNSLVCGAGNPDPLDVGETMGTSGGEIQSAFNSLISCWEDYVDANTGTDQLWNLSLPVISCPSNNVNPCSELKGAVNLNIVWITGAGEDPSYLDVPTSHAGWVAPVGSELDGVQRWLSFSEYFNLENVDGVPDDGIFAPYAKKSIYFLPDCTEHELKGVTGGQNFGVLAKIPVLVD